ncbi:YigZ family protein [Methanolobus sp. ZRKC3]|uniref:IMPACT family protein n=1 Tax=Methanolobus sp. ZRKC3 TaxID=3125786 RepID=UPI003247AD61
MEVYTTLSASGRSHKEYRNSAFIGYASPVSDEKEANEFIQRIKDKHKDANHNVSAYVVKSKNVLAIKYDDDGEPAGSSGKPIYKVLEMKNISNAVVVVTRYFGGIKLGFGGLAKAYRETAIEAIEDAGCVMISEKVVFCIKFSYHDLEKVKRLALSYGEIQEEIFSDKVSFRVDMDLDKKDSFEARLIDLTKNKVKIEICS